MAIDIILNANESAGLAVVMGNTSHFDILMIYGSLTKNCDNCQDAIVGATNITLPEYVYTTDDQCPGWKWE